MYICIIHICKITWEEETRRGVHTVSSRDLHISVRPTYSGVRILYVIGHAWILVLKSTKLMSHQAILKTAVFRSCCAFQKRQSHWNQICSVWSWEWVEMGFVWGSSLESTAQTVFVWIMSFCYKCIIFLCLFLCLCTLPLLCLLLYSMQFVG